MYAWHSQHVTMVTETQEWHIGIGQKAQWYNWWSSATFIRWHAAQRGSRKVCRLLLYECSSTQEEIWSLKSHHNTLKVWFCLAYFPALQKKVWTIVVVAKNMIPVGLIWYIALSLSFLFSLGTSNCLLLFILTFPHSEVVAYLKLVGNSKKQWILHFIQQLVSVLKSDWLSSLPRLLIFSPKTIGLL